MKYHMKRLFVDPYTPRSMCYAIRRPQHYPEGIVAVEQQSTQPGNAVAAEPLPTISRAMGVGPISFDLDAATTVQLSGPRWLLIIRISGMF